MVVTKNSWRVRKRKRTVQFLVPVHLRMKWRRSQLILSKKKVMSENMRTKLVFAANLWITLTHRSCQHFIIKSYNSLGILFSVSLMCSFKISPYSPLKGLKNSQGRDQKCKLKNKKNGSSIGIFRVVGSTSKKMSFCHKGGMDVFWNHAVKNQGIFFNPYSCKL